VHNAQEFGVERLREPLNGGGDAVRMFPGHLLDAIVVERARHHPRDVQALASRVPFRVVLGQTLLRQPIVHHAVRGHDFVPDGPVAVVAPEKARGDVHHEMNVARTRHRKHEIGDPSRVERPGSTVRRFLRAVRMRRAIEVSERMKVVQVHFGVLGHERLEVAHVDAQIGGVGFGFLFAADFVPLTTAGRVRARQECPHFLEFGAFQEARDLPHALAFAYPADHIALARGGIGEQMRRMQDLAGRFRSRLGGGKPAIGAIRSNRAPRHLHDQEQHDRPRNWGQSKRGHPLAGRSQ